MLRSILSCLAGVITAVIIISVVERVGQSIWPVPTGVNWTDKTSAKAAMDQMPTGALAAVATGWVLGTLVGGFLAARLGRRRWPAFVVGGLVVAASVANLLMLPHPVWFWPVALVLVPLAAVTAARLASGNNRGALAA